MPLPTLKLSVLVAIAAISIHPLLIQSAQANPALPITKIHFAGPGGVSDQRYGTFVVPEQDTAVSAYGGDLTRYEVHLAKMIEVAHRRWCQRPNYKGVHYNFFADDGNIFMGKFFVSCNLAKNAVKQIGFGKREVTIIRDRDFEDRDLIPVLDLRGEKKIRQFRTLLRELKPQCLNSMCPGDTAP